MIFMPPRHGKSEFVSKYYPPYHLGAFPDHRILLSSYESDFAAHWGGAARNVVEAFGPELWGISVDGRSHAADDWNLKGRRGGMMTAGIGGATTGKGADLLIIDDPVKDQKAARSRAIKNDTWDWYRAVARTRLHPGGRIILIQTRWAPDDLAGMLLGDMEEGTGEEWVVLSMPAFAPEPRDESGNERPPDLLGRAPGEALWPEMFPVPDLEAIRDTVGSKWWSSLYQQEPVDVEGGLFKRGWFDIVDRAPEKIKTVRYWDMAATEEADGTDPDWTRGCRMSQDTQKPPHYYIEHFVSLRGTPKANEDLVRQTAQADGPAVRIFMEQEPASAGKSLIDHYKRNVIPKKRRFEGDHVTGDKELRATPLAAAAEAGRVHLVEGKWNLDFLDESEAFPFGAHDDMVDSASGGFAKLQTPAGNRPIGRGKSKAASSRYGIPQHLIDNQRRMRRAMRGRGGRSNPLDGLLPGQ